MGIDIKTLIGGTLWVLGLAIVLTALSWANYEAQLLHLRFRKALAHPFIQFAINLGLMLFCFGFAIASQHNWERALWVVLAVAWLVQLVWNLRQK